MTWDLEPGDIIRRKELHQRFGGNPRGGTAPLTKSPEALVFSDPSIGAQFG